MTARSNAGWTVAGRPGRRLIAALLLGLMALVPACSAGASSGLKPVAPRTPVSTTPPGDGPLNQAHPAAQLRVELWGDSLGQQTADYLRYFFGAGGKVTAAIQAFGGTSSATGSRTSARSSTRRTRRHFIPKWPSWNSMATREHPA